MNGRTKNQATHVSRSPWFSLAKSIGMQLTRIPANPLPRNLIGAENGGENAFSGEWSQIRDFEQ